MGGSSSTPENPTPTSTEESKTSSYDRSFKILLIGDSGVGKSTLLASFSSDSAVDDLAATVGLDIEFKTLKVGDKTLELKFWDTAGQERFRTLTTSYYRDSHGIILVYDVTRKVTFENLSIWANDVNSNSTNQHCVKVLVGNKIDRESARAVSREEGSARAKDLGYLYFECSSRYGQHVVECLEELARKMLELPSPSEEGRALVVKTYNHGEKQEHQTKKSQCC